MTPSHRPLQLEIRRATVLRVSGDLDQRSIGQLRRVASDLVHDHGVTELLLDLTDTRDLKQLLPELIHDVGEWLAASNGALELRLPLETVEDVKAIAGDVPVFVPVPTPAADDSGSAPHR